MLRTGSAPDLRLSFSQKASKRIIHMLVVAVLMIAPQNVFAEGLTNAQKNAVRSAEQYLRFQGFSRTGLIEQLSSPYGDQYAVSDATAAVDSLPVDWNAQAARAAEQYLRMTGFSCKGLIDQLSSDFGEKFTPSQARYGATAAGAC